MKINSLLFFSFLLLAVISCNKPPYMPEGPATYIGTDDNTYGGDNEDDNLLSTIRVMTYNIHAASPPSRPDAVDLPAIATAIRRGNPDIVFLQEVDNGTNRNGYTGDMAAVLGEALNMNHAFFSARPHLRGYYGVAILSKYPLKSIRKYMLTKESDATEQRVLGTAIIDLPGVDSLVAAVTHLQHNSATNRLQQVRDIVDFLSPIDQRVIIGGDFNELETTVDFFGIFDNAFTRTCKGNCVPTFTALNPRSVIDYLAYKPANAFSIVSHNVVNETYASDHLPVIAELRFNR